MQKTKRRCAWAESNPLFIPYHDKEWGTPLHNDRRLFEMLNLEGAQAGLSWLTILQKRAHYRQVFDRFDARKVARYTAKKRAALMCDAGIVRNRLKIDAFIENAKAFLQVQKEFGSFDAYLWEFVGHEPIPHRKRKQALAISEKMSAALKKRGFRFVGPTICFAFMQATGMLNDHAPDCFLFAPNPSRRADG